VSLDPLSGVFKSPARMTRVHFKGPLRAFDSIEIEGIYKDVWECSCYCFLNNFFMLKYIKMIFFIF
jgi:hypothetical protein